MTSKELSNLLSRIDEYRGKHVVVVDDEIVVVRDEKELEKTIDELEKKYPDRIPLVTFVPKKGVLVL